jgi:hypothetical protein
VKDPRTLTEVRHAKSYEWCETCSDLGRSSEAVYAVANSAQCVEHAATSLTNGIVRTIARYAITEAADLDDEWIEAVS